jgi:hypothetical protein
MLVFETGAFLFFGRDLVEPKTVQQTPFSKQSSAAAVFGINLMRAIMERDRPSLCFCPELNLTAAISYSANLRKDGREGEQAALFLPFSLSLSLSLSLFLSLSLRACSMSRR